jgi:transposase
MTTSIAPVGGIDISKDHLDAAIHPGTETRRFTNERTGHTALLRWLERMGVQQVVFEATGPYHRTLERRFVQTGLSFAKVNPRQAGRFAEATGTLAKTDRVDAIGLARFGALVQPECRPPRSETLDQLAELVAARRMLVKDRTATTNRANTLTLALLKRQATLRLKQIARQLAALDAQARHLVAADCLLARRLVILTSIPGLGEITAIALIADMPELGQMDAKQAASLAGLAPVARQSGTWRGKSFIRGGRAHLRQALYMPALVAARFNPDLKARFAAMSAAGKPAKVAFTALMRRLVVLATHSCATIGPGSKRPPSQSRIL